MKTRNRHIYHCLACGNVVHADVSAQPPECCADKMVRAAAETVRDTEVSAETATGEPETASPLERVRTKPR